MNFMFYYILLACFLGYFVLGLICVWLASIYNYYILDNKIKYGVDFKILLICMWPALFCLESITFIIQILKPILKKLF